MRPKPNPSDATLLMRAAAGGDRSAPNRLLPLVYEQLRQAAQLSLSNERPGHTLSATVLVHEVYLKLVGPREALRAGQAHVCAAAAEAMRRVLLDHATARGREKRGRVEGRPARRVDFASVAYLAAAANSPEILSFDAALCRLEAESTDTARIVQLRSFAGLTVEQTGKAMAVSDRTVNRLWLYARAWLDRAIGESSGKSKD